MLSVVCVLRSGGDYQPEHVRALFARVARFWPKDAPLRFVCLTDTPISSPGIEERPLQHDWKGWWAKMELFDGAQDDLGDILYMDLDTIPVGGLSPIMAPKPLTLLRDFYHHERIQSGLMYLPAASRPEACAAWLEDPAMAADRYRGDGEFLDLLWRGTAATWQELCPDQVVSYKVDVRQRKGQTIPPGARVVCFQGKPRPWNTPLWARST